LGVSSAVNYVSTNSYSGTYFEKDWITVEWASEFNWGYSTLYENGPIDDDLWLQEGYGFRMQSNATYTFSFELFNFYAYEGEIFLNLIDFAPLKVYLAWYRPEYTFIDGTNFWDLRFIGKYDLRGPYLEYSVVENAKTFTSSFFDWVDNIDDTDYLPWPYEVSDFEYDEEIDYTDPDFGFEFVDLFLNSEGLFFYGDDVTLFDIYAINSDLNSYFTIPQKN
jgi:hypothetical protein